jgi:hypothetical protein
MVARSREKRKGRSRITVVRDSHDRIAGRRP